MRANKPEQPPSPGASSAPLAGRLQFKGFFGFGGLVFDRDLPTWLREAVSTDYGKTGAVRGAGRNEWLLVTTPKGKRRLRIGDWIVRADDGSFRVERDLPSVGALRSAENRPSDQSIRTTKDEAVVYRLWKGA